MNKSKLSPVYDFKDAPKAMTIVGDTIMIASSRGFYLINQQKKEKIRDNLFWSGLYPNSIVVADNRTAYVGIRGGYTKIDLQTRQLTFYRYNK